MFFSLKHVFLCATKETCTTLYGRNLGIELAQVSSFATYSPESKLKIMTVNTVELSSSIVNIAGLRWTRT
jgi:hypothetical protein